MIHRRVLLAAAVLTVAACMHAKPPAPVPEHAQAPSGPKLPGYRFVPGNGMQVTALEGGGVGVLEGATRSVVAVDGTIEKARSTTRDFLMGGEPVPAKLGGGFLFWSMNGMYRARSFLAPLEPVAPLPTNAIDLAFGPSSLLVVDPEGSRKAYDLEKAQRVPLSPPGVLDIATGDDERAVAVDSAGRALASIDGGKTWKDVTAQLGGRPGRPFAADAHVGFEIDDKQGVWLEADGTMGRGPLPDHHRANATASGLGEVMFALRMGVPLPGGQALLGRGPEVKTVDLRTGAVLSNRIVAPGKSCRVLSTDDEGLADCYDYSIDHPSITIVSHVLGATPHMEKTFEGTIPVVYGAGVLVVSAGCDGAPSTSLGCARRSGGTWTQYDPHAAVDATANPPPPGPVATFLDKPFPVTWVPREGGGVTALATKRPVKTGEQFRVARFDPPAGPPVFLDKVISSLEHYRWVVGRDGTLRGFGLTSSIAVDARGHVETGRREFTSLAAADPLHALATDDAHRLWQTIDGGAHWIEVAPPPGPPPSEVWPSQPMAMQCSPVGCILPGTGGTWLRTGWPEDPPSRIEDAGAVAQDVSATASDGASATASDAGGDRPTDEVSSPPPAAPPARALPRLRCMLGAAPRAIEPHVEPHTAKPSTKGEPPKAMLGGLPLPERGTDQVFVNLAFRDQYTGAGDTTGPQSIGHGLRAIAHFRSVSQWAFDLAQLIEDKAAIDAMYVEPFDPAGTIVHASSPFADWARTTGRFPDPVQLSAGNDTGARPVLSNRPGHTDGVLLDSDPLVVWVDHTGAVRPVLAVQQGRAIYGGYVDARGKLLVASETSEGGTQVLDAVTGNVRLDVPDVLPFYPLLRTRASTYPEIPMHVFADPDAIAVAPDGAVGILRVPSANEPSTEDDPALFMTGNGPAVPLAPWSTIEMASSPACKADHAGYRAIIQTGLPWVTMEGSPGFRFRTPGMSAMVRWGKDRVCLESIEVGYENLDDSSSPTYGLKVMAVARFVGDGAGAGLVGTGRDATVRQAATCTLE